MLHTSSVAGEGVKRITLKNICGQERESLLEKVELLDHSNQKLNFEGKLHIEKNAKEAWRLVNFFCGKIKEYVKTEEKEIFPSLENYLSQYDCMFLHFRAEHETLLNELSRLRRLLQSLIKNIRSSKSSETRRRIHQRGLYVSHLLRHHLKSERNYLSKAIHQKVAPEERKKIISRLKML